MHARSLPFAALCVAAFAPAQQVADTQFSVPRGLYDTTFTLQVTTATPGATIRVTLDCSDPRTSANVITGPSPLAVTIDPTSTVGGRRPLTPAVVVRAWASAPGMTPTNVDTATYVFRSQVLAQTRPSGFPTSVSFTMDPAVVANPLYARLRDDLAALPTMSVVAPYTSVFGSGGLLTASNGSIEVPGSIEVIHPDGRDDQVDCGLTPHSWTQQKRSLRVYFRAAYGADKWRHDLFRAAAEGYGNGVTSFDGLVLRAGFNDGLLYGEVARQGRYSFAVDDLARSSQVAMTGFGARGIFVHLYLNGLYWGLYNPVERPESSYWSDTFGGSKDDYFARNHGGPVDGSSTWFDGLIAGAANWTTVQSRLDVPSFCDYILYWQFCGGGDWPSYNGSNNNWYAGNRVLPQPGKVRFFVWDCEDSWIHLPNRPGPPHDGARLLQELLTGPLQISQLWRGVQAQAEFRLQWADRVYRQCFLDGPLAEGPLLRRWNRITNVVDRGVVGESARWGRFDPRGVTWTRNADWLPYTNSIRGMFVGNTPQLVAALRNTTVPVAHPLLYPVLDAPRFVTGPSSTPIEVTEARVAPGFTLSLQPTGAFGTVYYTLDGSDPRGPGGAIAGTAATGPIPIPGTVLLRARTNYFAEWSAVHELLLHVQPSLPAVQIHEVLAENVVGLVDEAGDHDDWIELKNLGPVPFDLSGHHLTDSLALPTKWTFPAGTVLPAGETLLVWADDESTEGPLHATFRLSGNGESVGLFAPGGAVSIDQWSFGPQRDDVSNGRLDADPTLLVAFPRPTPDRTNRAEPCGHLRYQALDALANPLDLRGLGVPTAGDSLRYEVEGVPAGTAVLLGLGLAPRHQVLPGLGTLLVDPLLLLFAPADAGGEARFALGLPDLAATRGAAFVAQAAADVGAGLRLSNGVASRVCR